MFSNATVQAQTSAQEVRGDLVLELLHAVDGHHRDPHAVAPGELGVGVHVDHLEGERGPFALGRQHRGGRLAEVAPGPRVEGDAARRARLGRAAAGGAAAAPPGHGWRRRGGVPPGPGLRGAGRGPGSGAEARRKPAYITVAPRASPVASLSLALAKASSTPAAISRLPSKRGRRSRRPRSARPLATAPPTTTTVPTTLPPTARARMPTGSTSLPSGTTRPVSPAARTSTSATAATLARVNRTSPSR